MADPHLKISNTNLYFAKENLFVLANPESDSENYISEDLLMLSIAKCRFRIDLYRYYVTITYPELWFRIGVDITRAFLTK